MFHWEMESEIFPKVMRRTAFFKAICQSVSDCARAQRIHKIDRQGHYCRQQLWFGMCYVIKHTIITINSLFNKSTEGRK